MPVDLKGLVLSKIEEDGVKSAANFFGVSIGTISNWQTGKTQPSISAVQLILADKDIETIISTSEPSDEIPLEKWDGKKLIMLYPIYRGFSDETHYTLFANYAKYGPDKIGMIMEKRTVIHESRNILIHKALKTDAPTFIMGDDDMLLPCGSKELINGRYGAGLPADLASQVAISRLMSHPPEIEIVGCLYFGRHDKGRAQCSSGFVSDSENELLHRMTLRGLRREEWVGTGLIRIQRTALEKMKKAIDEGLWPECKPKGPDGWHGFFTPLGTRMGEDVSFGRRATQIGIQSYVDTSLVCGHTGTKHFWASNTKTK